MVRLLLALLTAALLGLTAAGPAAALELAKPASAPTDVAGGAHADLVVHIEPRGGDLRDLDLALPPGLVGDPAVTPLCTLAQFEANGCPAGTRIGTTTTTVAVDTLGGARQTLPGDVFNLAPRGAEPARLGIVLRPPSGDPVRLESPVVIRPEDSGLTSTLRDLPRTASGLEVTITALDVRLFGRAGGRPFLTNPTSCGPATTVFTARGYDGTSARAEARFTPTGCDRLPFTPTLSATVGGVARGAGVPLTTITGQPGEQANARRVAVTLPREVSPAPDVAIGGIIGSASATTPLLRAPLAGPVAFVERPDALPSLQLRLAGATTLTLTGSSQLEDDSSLTTTFDGLPDVPLSRFALSLEAGKLLKAGRDLCVDRAPRVRAAFTSQAGQQATVRTAATVTGCPRLRLSASPARVRAGRRTRVQVRIRPAREGATVRFAGRSAMTDERGIARFSVRLRRGARAATVQRPVGRALRATVTAR